MADLKLSDLLAAQTLTDDTFLYAVQGGVSKKLSANVVLKNLRDPVIKGSIFLDGVQLIRGTQPNQNISLAVSRTEFDVGPFIVYPILPNSPQDGLLKVITLANVQGGSVQITTANSNIYPNVSVSMERQGDSMLLLYSANSYSNGWVILGTTPGLKTSLELDEANITDERIRRAISAGDETIRYDEANGKIFVGDISNLVTKVSLTDITSDDIPEGAVNLFFSEDKILETVSPALEILSRPAANVIYVAQNGDDIRDGKTPANAVANIHVAISRLQQPFQSVQVFPGDYTLYGNPVTLPPRTSLIGNDLRTTTVRPENQTSDMFYMNNGCYVFGFTFRDHRAANPNNVRTGSAVFSYNPDGSAGNITTSPYIQNCSSITTTGTGVRVNGDHVGGLKSMVLDAFTQFNEGGMGIHLLNQGYMQLVSLFTICCEYSVLCENGGFGSITNSNTSFGKFGLVADGVSPTLYSAKVIRQVTTRIIEMIADKIPNVNDRIIMANYNQDKCFRDTGLIVDSFALDLAYAGNTQTRFSGIQYWSQGLNLVRDQRIEVFDALTYMRELCTNVVVNSTAWDNSLERPYQQGNTQVILGANPGNSLIVSNLFNQLIDIYENGVFGFTDKIIPNNYPANTNAIIQNTANLLIQNRNFIQNEVTAYFTTEYSYATFIPGRSFFNEVGDILDSLTFDVLHGGNRQVLTRGALFWDYILNDPEQTQVRNQVVQTSGAFSFIKTFIDEILTNEIIETPFQTQYTQNTTAAPSATLSEITYVRNRIDDLTGIIINGPQFLNTYNNIRSISVNPNNDPNVVNATKIILANRDFIRAEVLEYVNQNWKDLSNGTRNFYTVNSVNNITAGPNNTVICNVTFDERIRSFDRPLANTRVSFHQGSYLSTSSHTFEYVGSGTQLLPALPYNGGKPIQDNEVVESRGGAIFYTSTDHKGDFRIGNELFISRADGTINGRTFNKSLFAVMTPYILAIQ
jgi:hypothetical protein